MGTRGSVAWKEGRGYMGVYNHFDSYPIGLGPDLWAMLSARKFDMEQLIEELKSSKRWENLVNSEPIKDGDELFNPFKDPLYMEYIYVLNPKERVVEVWASTGVPVTKKVKGAVKYKSLGCCYKHVRIARCPVDEAEPNWQKIQNKEDEIVARGGV